MLELFSRAPDVLEIAEGRHLTSLPTKEEVSSLPAILMDGEYYELIRAGRKETDGLPWIDAEQPMQAARCPSRASGLADSVQRPAEVR